MIRAISVVCVLLGPAAAFADDAAWSDSAVERPLTLPASKMAIYGDADMLKLDLGGISATAELVHGGVGYGVTDQLTIGVDYAVNLHSSTSVTVGGVSASSDDSLPGNGRGPVIPYVSFRALHGPLSIAVSGGLVANLANSTVDAMGNMSYSTTYTLIAGALVKYNISPSFAVYSGAPVGGGILGFASSPFGPGPLGNQLEIGLSKTGSTTEPSRAFLPIGIAVQASPQVFAFAQTTLMGAYVANAPTGADNPVFIGSDSTKGGLGIPAVAGVFVSATHDLELGATLAFPDLQHVGDLYAFGLAARVYTGI